MGRKANDNELSLGETLSYLYFRSCAGFRTPVKNGSVDASMLCFLCPPSLPEGQTLQVKEAKAASQTLSLQMLRRAVR
jgi:hypothetical protein